MTFVDQGDKSCFDDFAMNVLSENEDDDCFLEVYEDGNNYRAGQDDPAVFLLYYRGANRGKTGNDRKEDWNIFWYTRSDANPQGTPASPLSNLPTITSPASKPKVGKPSLSATEIDYVREHHENPSTPKPAGTFNGYLAFVDQAGLVQSYWKDSFTSEIPDSGTDQDEIAVNAGNVSFTGRAQIR